MLRSDYYNLAEERRQQKWDEHLERLPICCICKGRIMDGEEVHETRGKQVCASCMEELEENLSYVEVD